MCEIYYINISLAFGKNDKIKVNCLLDEFKTKLYFFV